MLSPVTDACDALRWLKQPTDWSGVTDYAYFQDGTPQSVQDRGEKPHTFSTKDPLTTGGQTSDKHGYGNRAG